jgi:ubiquinone/menaquinone biosynthesis C-methylase UbiE
MHASSLENMQKCYQKYVKKWFSPQQKNITVIDIGGANINGAYADIFSGKEFVYKSADISSAENIDIILKDPYKLPFQDGSIDILISGQVFEHVEFFWLLFAEMVRVLKEDGLIFLIAPSQGKIHRYPVDCYRFYPDSYRALAKYTKCTLFDVWRDKRGPWKDIVGVFCKLSKEQAYRQIQNKSEVAWQRNRYEQEFASSFSFQYDEDKKTEIIQGDVHYLEVLKRLHYEIQPNLYVEIGVGFGHSLKLAECQSIGIDPECDIKVELQENHMLIRETSDNFFENIKGSLPGDRRIDLAFIDGMHLFEFVLRDFINIEKHSTAKTLVVIDDIFPNHPVQAERLKKSMTWTGDVWKIILCLKSQRPDLKLTCLNSSPTGLLVIAGLDQRNRALVNKYNPIVQKYKSLALEGETKKKFLQREGAIDSMDHNYWQWLKKYVNKRKDVTTAKGIRKK